MTVRCCATSSPATTRHRRSGRIWLIVHELTKRGWPIKAGAPASITSSPRVVRCSNGSHGPTLASRPSARGRRNTSSHIKSSTWGCSCAPSDYRVPPPRSGWSTSLQLPASYLPSAPGDHGLTSIRTATKPFAEHPIAPYIHPKRFSIQPNNCKSSTPPPPPTCPVFRGVHFSSHEPAVEFQALPHECAWVLVRTIR